ncbi:MAG TPA: CoA transferase [Dehalococcoidia bacterium]|nr:CoA transferase [Dehalococcoidia bacterium]
MGDNHSENQPLKGIRALEWGAFHAGPGALAILGDLGAEVIKIELPKSGDPIRLLTRFGNFPVSKNGYSVFYEGANRHKKSIALDLSKKEGKQIAYRLVSKCDVFLTNFRANAVESQRMTYADLREINPRLIYAAVSAFGSRGPDRDAGGFDFLGQARSGLMMCTGEPDMPPLISQFGLIDQVTAITASHAILTALYVRERTGLGQELKVSLLSSAMFLQYFNVLTALMMGQDVPRHQRKSTDPLRNFYECRDGKWLCMTVAHHPTAWRNFCLAIDHPELEHDARFENRDRRFENRDDFIAFLDTVFVSRTRDEWVPILSERDVFCSPVNTAVELTKDPQTTANDYVIDTSHRLFGDIKVPGYPIEFSETPANPGFTAPKLGEHTREILRDIGGYSETEITRFQKDGVVDGAA